MRRGFYSRQAPPKRIPRFLCVHCKRSFSSQTFRIDYYLRRPELLTPTFWRVLSCSAYRQIAREFHASPSTIARHVERLARHCLLFLEAHPPPAPITEPLVLDGFESFEFSQFYPFHINHALGADSHWQYGATESELRRKGRMTPAQKEKRAREEQQVGRPDPQAVVKGVAELVRLIARGTSRLVIRTDEHRAYPRAFRRVSEVEVVHEATSSKLARTHHNPLYPVNRMDLMKRHGGANHKRETIAYSKRRQGAMERDLIHTAWWNYMKPVSIKRNDETPAQRLGVFGRRLGVEELLGVRLFPSRFRLPAVLQRIYDREIRTRRIPNGARHRLRYAY